MNSYNCFPESLNRDNAFDSWYRDIRVDLLADDELAFELAVRNIAVEGDRSQMRRCLRARLKIEKQDGICSRTLKTDPTKEVQQCKDKLEEIEKVLRDNKKENLTVCRDRLLHLGARAKLIWNYVPDALNDDVLSVFTIVTDHLYYFFYKSVSFGFISHESEEENESENEPEDVSIPSLEDLLKDISEEANIISIDKKVLIKEVNRRKRAEEAEAYLKTENMQFRRQISMTIPKTWNAQVQTEPNQNFDMIPNLSSCSPSIPLVSTITSSRWPLRDTSVPSNRANFNTPISYTFGR